MAIASDYQLEFAGLLVGNGTDYEIVSIRGLDDLPDVRISDTERPSDHGMFAGADLAGGRIIDVELEVVGATDVAFRANVDALGLATVLRDAEAPLSFRLPGANFDRRINCRPRRRALPNDLDYFFRRSPAVIQFFATDPRVYSDTETVLSGGPTTSGGGRTYDRTYNLVYAAGGAGGTFIFTNVGTFPSRPEITISGPATDPRVENVTAGEFVRFSGLTLAAGEFIDLDFAARTAMLGGTASRYNLLTTDSRWWELAPGTSEIKFTTADSLGTMALRARSAWL